MMYQSLCFNIFIVCYWNIQHAILNFWRNTMAKCMSRVQLLYHWENCLHFVYAPRCVSFFYAPSCINAPQKVNLQKMHPAAFYFSCTYTNGISLRIIMKNFIITQTLINETALNLLLLLGLQLPTQSRNLKQFHSLIFFDYCRVLKTELTLVYRPILYIYIYVV